MTSPITPDPHIHDIPKKPASPGPSIIQGLGQGLLQGIAMFILRLLGIAPPANSNQATGLLQTAFGNILNLIGTTANDVAQVVVNTVGVIGAGAQNVLDTIVNGLSGLVGGFGYTLNQLFNHTTQVSQLTQQTSTTQSQQTIAKPNYLAVDASADAVFPIAQIQGSTPTYVSVTAGNSVIGFLPTPDNAKKNSLIWLGQNTSNITGFYLNIYKVNTSTGALTLVQASTNIIASVSNVLAWNYYNLPTPLNTNVGDVYAVEVVVTGTGTYSIAGLPNHWLPANTQVKPQQMAATRPVGVTYDATGGGYTALPNSSAAQGGSWTHTATAGATVLVGVGCYIDTSVSLASYTRTATYGGTAMTSLGAVKVNNATQGWVELFALSSAPGGAQTVSFSISAGGGTFKVVAANSVSYNSASSIGTAVTNFGNQNPTTGAVSSETGGRVVAVMNANNGSAVATASGYTGGTSRWLQNLNQSTNYMPFTIGDAAGATTVTQSETLSNWSFWGTVAVDLPPLITPPPTSPSFTYSGNVPWFGFGAVMFAGPLVTQYNTVGTYTYTLPNWLKYGDKIDVALLGGGGGGQGSAFYLVGTGGDGGGWSLQTLTYGVDIPTTTTTLTVTVGAGGTAGTASAQVGGVGGNTTVTGTGVVTVSPGMGGKGGGTGANPGGTTTGLSPGNQTFNTVTYTGGGTVSAGVTGAAPGGGGGGGGPYGPGAAGGVGSAWLTAYQAGTTP